MDGGEEIGEGLIEFIKIGRILENVFDAAFLKEIVLVIGFAHLSGEWKVLHICQIFLIVISQHIFIPIRLSVEIHVHRVILVVTAGVIQQLIKKMIWHNKNITNFERVKFIILKTRFHFYAEKIITIFYDEMDLMF